MLDPACLNNSPVVFGRPKKGKVGRSPPAEEVEAFLAAAERGMARRFAVK
jgi:hypothetical protein